MGQDKMQLTKLLAFVKELYDHPDNKIFAAGLNAIVLNRLTITTNQDIKKVKEALELRADYSIDYSFVKDIFVQRQLMIDNLRMENVLLNLSMSEIERYDNFCVNAFLQVENILNYYFCEKYNKNLDSILTAIEDITQNDKYPFKRIPNKTYLYVSEIPIASKIQAFCNEFFPFDSTNTDYTTKNLHTLRNMRNDIFHRAGEGGDKTSDETKKGKTATKPTAAVFRDTLRRLVLEVKNQL